MAEFKLDRLKFRWRGNWASTINYRKDDVITYQGKAYVCLQAHVASTNFYTDRDPTTGETIAVRVGADALNNQAQGQFTFDNINAPVQNLLQGRTYTFDCSDNTTINFNTAVNILKFSSTKDGKWNGGDTYNIGVSYELDSVAVTEAEYDAGYSTATTRHIIITVSADSPERLYYFSTTNPGMGNELQTRYGSYWELMSDGQVWKGDWTRGQYYSEGEIVKYRGRQYKCIVQHTSQVILDFEDDIAHWELFKTGYDWNNTWAENTDYKVDDVIRYNGVTYICNSAHTSNSVLAGLEFDIAKWTIISETENWKGDWTISTRYMLHDVVKYGGYVYRCIQYHTSADNANVDGLELDQAKWVSQIQGIEYKGDWSGATRYKVGDVVKNDASLYKCKLGHTSNATALRNDESAAWDLYIPGLDFEGRWNSTTEYQKGDIVLHGGYVYTSLTNNVDSVPGAVGLAQDTGDWEVTLTGYRALNDYDETLQYRTGDVVRYSGYLYQAKVDTLAESPTQQPLSWQILVPGRQFRNAWEDNVTYYVGDIVTWAGTTYECILEHTSTNSDSRPDLDIIQPDQNYWKVSIKGADGNKLTNFGDIKVYDTESTRLAIGSSGNVLKVGTDSIPKWEAFEEVDRAFFVSPEGTDSAVNGKTAAEPFKTVKFACDYARTNPAFNYEPNLTTSDYQDNITGIGLAILQIQAGADIPDAPNFKAFLQTQTDDGYTYADIVRDSTDSTDDANFFELYKLAPEDAPSQDITDSINNIIIELTENTTPYIGEYVEYNGTNYSLINSIPKTTTINIKTGVYREQIPILVPANTALVGDELRSTRIEPAPGLETANMFYVRNGSGIRNMTLQGLTGELGAPNANNTRRPTAGAYVSLDPGDGSDDTAAWITTKSPYVQNVSTFGTGCIGMKVDGALHDGGNKSIVANDFTQVLSDGIGYWANKDGKSELVSVFTYYNHIGYLCTDGGKLRATNGNNSYGDYGSVAEGFNADETPVTAKIDNRTKQAETGRLFTYGTDEQKLLAVAYKNAGETYTSATISFAGAGQYGTGKIDEIRNGAVSNVRVDPKGDSTVPGGFDYQFVANTAQGGDTLSITLAQADVGTPAKYIGQRIVIVSGKGVGQYGEITDFDATGKIVIVSRESDGKNGWDHFQPGYPIEATLDSTTRYNIEPKITFTEPLFEATSVNGPESGSWQYIVYGSSKYVAATTDGKVAVSTDGTSWTSNTITSDTCEVSGLVFDGTNFIVSFASYDNAATDKFAYTTTGSSWTVSTGAITANWHTMSSINGKTVMLARNGSYQYSDAAAIGTWAGKSASDANNPLVTATQAGRDFTIIRTLDNRKWVDPHCILQAMQGSGGLLGAFMDETVQATGFVRKDINNSGGFTSKDTDCFTAWLAGTNGADADDEVTYNRSLRIEKIFEDLVARKISNSASIEDTYGGKQVFYDGVHIAFDATDGYFAWSVDGEYWITWDHVGTSGLPVSPRRVPQFQYSDGAYGANKLVLIGAEEADSAFGFIPTVVTQDGQIFETGYIQEGIFTNISYATGTFLATGNSSFAAKSTNGLYWNTYGDDSATLSMTDFKSFTASASAGDNDWIVLVDGSNQWDKVSTGTRAIGRVIVTTSRIAEVEIYEPGSGYTDGLCFATLYDNENTRDAILDVNIRNGVLGPPTITYAGEGYTTATATISGDGYAENYQTGTTLFVKDLSAIPGPGSNLNIGGIDEVLYSVTKVSNQQLISGSWSAEFLISPSLQADESPAHEVDCTIREQFSQVRLTGHDFLDIGTGNISSTRYPTLYLEGENPADDPKPFNETVIYNGGRVFYTSTDQDGNFKVGDLFEVEQARGVVTISATQFNLSGLTELSLGGIQVGASAVVIREFSKETSFIANSDNIVPTQKAIAAYLESRISGGGSNATTNTLVAGQVQITSNTLSSAAELYVNIDAPVNAIGGIDGHLLATQYLLGSSGE